MNDEPSVYFKIKIPDWNNVHNSIKFSTFVTRIKKLQYYINDGKQIAVDSTFFIADAAEKLIPYLKDLVQKYKLKLSNIIMVSLILKNSNNMKNIIIIPKIMLQNIINKKWIFHIFLIKLCYLLSII